MPAVPGDTILRNELVTDPVCTATRRRIIWAPAYPYFSRVNDAVLCRFFAFQPPGLEHTVEIGVVFHDHPGVQGRVVVVDFEVLMFRLD